MHPALRLKDSDAFLDSAEIQAAEAGFLKTRSLKQ